MKVLVTGCRGTIGRPLCRALAAQGHAVVGVDLVHATLPWDRYRRADVANHRELARAIAELQGDGRRIDVVYHLAAEFGRLNGAEHFETLWRTNCVGLRTLVDLLRSGAAATDVRLVHASTSEVYGAPSPKFRRPTTRVVREADGHDHVQLDEAVADDCPRPLNDYAISKYANELQLRTAGTDRDGLAWAGVRIFNCYGPGEVGTARRSVVSRFIHALLHREPCLVYERTARDALYIDDLVAALVRFLDRDTFEQARADFTNLAGGEYHTIGELFDLLVDLVHEEVGTPVDELRALAVRQDFEPGNSRDKLPARERAARLLNWSPRVSLRDGLRATIRWVRGQADTAGW